MGTGETGRTPDGEPRPVADIDGDDLFDYLQPLHRVRWIILAGFGLVMAATLILLSVGYTRQSAQLAQSRQVIAAQQREIRASCEFWDGVLTLPVVATPPAAQPSRVLVTLIASSRDAWSGEHCGPLPPVTRDLRRWAGVYQVPLRS